jgi:hypothetical protein
VRDPFAWKRLGAFMARIFFAERQRLSPGVITLKIAVLINKHGRALPDAF